MVATEEKLEILRDITEANRLIQSIEGGAASLPKLARGDLGAMWTIDLASQIGLAGAWLLSQSSLNTPDAGGTASSALAGDFAIGDVLAAVTCYVAFADAGKLKNVSLTYDPGGGFPLLVFAWDDSGHVVNWEDSAGFQRLFVIDQDQNGAFSRLPLPLIDTVGALHTPTLTLRTRSEPGAVGAFFVNCDVWTVRFDRSMPGRNPLLTTERFE